MKQTAVLALLVTERRLQSGQNVVGTGSTVTVRREQLERLVALGVARYGTPGDNGQLTIEYITKEN